MLQTRFLFTPEYLCVFLQIKNVLQYQNQEVNVDIALSTSFEFCQVPHQYARKIGFFSCSRIQSMIAHCIQLFMPFSGSFLKNTFIYLFLAVLGLHCFEGFLQLWRAGLLCRCDAPASHFGGVLLWNTGSRTPAQQLWRLGLVVPRYVGLSQIRDRICVCRTCRWTCYHEQPGKPPLAVLCVIAQSCPDSLRPHGLGSPWQPHSPPGSLSMGILQARILEWVAMPSSRGSSQPRG